MTTQRIEKEYDVEILDALNLKPETFENLARALENPWLLKNIKIPDEYQTIIMSHEEFLEHEDIIILSGGIFNTDYEAIVPYGFKKHNYTLKPENAVLRIMPGHLDGPQIYLGGEDRLSFTGERAYLFGRRPKEPSSIKEKLTPFLEKEGTIYVAENTPNNDYAIRTTKIDADTSIALLHGAIIRNAEGVSISNIGKSRPMYVFLKKRDVESIMLRIYR